MNVRLHRIRSKATRTTIAQQSDAIDATTNGQPALIANYGMISCG